MIWSMLARRCDIYVVYVVDIVVSTRGMPKRTWIETTRKDLEVINLMEGDALNRTKGNKRIHANFRTRPLFFGGYL